MCAVVCLSVYRVAKRCSARVWYQKLTRLCSMSTLSSTQHSTAGTAMSLKHQHNQPLLPLVCSCAVLCLVSHLDLLRKVCSCTLVLFEDGTCVICAIIVVLALCHCCRSRSHAFLYRHRVLTDTHVCTTTDCLSVVMAVAAIVCVIVSVFR
jgi:hypothetical protein